MTSKTTKSTRTSITWRRVLYGDEGEQFAVMTATLNPSNPFGSTTFVVDETSAFNDNRDAAQEAYTEFATEFAELVSGTSTLTTETEEAE